MIFFREKFIFILFGKYGIKRSDKHRFSEAA